MVVLLLFINKYSILYIKIIKKVILDVMTMLGFYLALIDQPNEKITEIMQLIVVQQ